MVPSNLFVCPKEEKTILRNDAEDVKMVLEKVLATTRKERQLI
jgi:hypothetical protein